MRPKGMRNAALLTGMVFLLAQTGRIPAVSAEKNAHMEQGKEQAAEADPARVETEQPAEEELSMEEAVAVMEEPPAEEAVPTAEEAPVEEAVPVMEEPLAGEAAPAAEELSMEEAVAVMEEAPVEEAVPVMEEPPAGEAAPAAEEWPVAEAVPVMEEPPVWEAAPTAEELSVEEAVPVMEEAPAGEAAPSAEEWQVAEAVPVMEEPPVEDASLAVEEVPMEETAPVMEEPSAREAVPITEETAAVEETSPITEETVTEKEAAPVTVPVEEAAAPTEETQPEVPAAEEPAVEKAAPVTAPVEEAAAPTEETQPAAPAAEAAPAEETAPAAEAAPVEETAPAAETTPAEETAPAAETAPAEETAPAAETTPAEETAPAAEAAPVEETAPAAETTPAEKTAPAAEAAPVEETAPAAETAPVEETAPAAETAPAEETAPAAETAPMEETASVAEELPLEGTETNETDMAGGSGSESVQQIEIDLDANSISNMGKTDPASEKKETGETGETGKTGGTEETGNTEIRFAVKVNDHAVDPESLQIRASRFGEEGTDFAVESEMSEEGVFRCCLKGIPEDPSGDGVYIVTAVAVDQAGNTIVSTREIRINRYGSVYRADTKTTGLLEQGYHQEAFPLQLEEKNVDQLSDSVLMISRNGGALREIGKSDVTVTAHTDEKGWNTYSYYLPQELFNEEGEYAVRLISDDAAGNHNYSGTEGETLDFAIDRTPPDLLVPDLADGAVYCADEIWFCLHARDNSPLEELRVYRNGKILTYSEGISIQSSDNTLKWKLSGEDDLQTLQFYARDAAGNESWSEEYTVRVMPETESVSLDRQGETGTL